MRLYPNWLPPTFRHSVLTAYSQKNTLAHPTDRAVSLIGQSLVKWIGRPRDYILYRIEHRLISNAICKAEESLSPKEYLDHLDRMQDLDFRFKVPRIRVYHLTIASLQKVYEAVAKLPAPQKSRILTPVDRVAVGDPINGRQKDGFTAADNFATASYDKSSDEKAYLHFSE